VLYELSNSTASGDLDRLTFNVIYLLQAFSYAIFPTAVWQLIRFQLTWSVARSLCDSWASCCEAACR